MGTVSPSAKAKTRRKAKSKPAAKAARKAKTAPKRDAWPKNPKVGDLALSRREYARWRREKGLRGCTLDAVQRALEDGRISLSAAGETKIDPVVADREWAENTQQQPGAVGTSLARRVNEAKAKRAEIEAKEAELRYRKSVEELIERAEVERLWTSAGRRISEAVIAAGHGVAPDLVGLEQREIDIRLHEALVEALAAIADSGHAGLGKRARNGSAARGSA